MPKPSLTDEDAILEREIIATMLAGLKEWRPDLHYPESHSDMQGCVRAVLRMFKVERRPLVEPLRIECHECGGLGQFRQDKHHAMTCQTCHGRGYVFG